MRVDVGRADGVADTTCVAIADGAAVIVRVGQRVRAYRNRCLHQDAPLHDGWVRDGVLVCPLHFWRYRVDDGTLLDGPGCLEALVVTEVDGRVFVDLPDPPPPMPLRDQLLARARRYDRDAAYRRDAATALRNGEP